VSAHRRRVNCVPQWRGSPGRPVIAVSGTFAVPVMYSWFPRLRTYTAISHRRFCGSKPARRWRSPRAGRRRCAGRRSDRGSDAPDVELVAALDVEDDVLEPDAALRPELRVLRGVPVEVLHRFSGYHDVCLIGTPWRQSQCARHCAQTRSEYHQSAANANQATNEKRA
jgi:hypothetical protein